MYLLWFTKTYSQDTDARHVHAMDATAADAFEIEPDELTLAFSVIDRNDPPLGVEGLTPYINFMYYMEEVNSDGTLRTTPIKAEKCLDLYSDTYADDPSFLA